MWTNANGNPFVGYIGSGVPKLKAFLNHGFLLPRDFGLDVRVVDVPAAGSTIKFQWKLSTQKVRTEPGGGRCRRVGPRAVAAVRTATSAPNVRPAPR